MCAFFLVRIYPSALLSECAFFSYAYIQMRFFPVRFFPVTLWKVVHMRRSLKEPLETFPYYCFKTVNWLVTPSDLEISSNLISGDRPHSVTVTNTSAQFLKSKHRPSTWPSEIETFHCHLPSPPHLDYQSPAAEVIFHHLQFVQVPLKSSHSPVTSTDILSMIFFRYKFLAFARINLLNLTAKSHLLVFSNMCFSMYVVNDSHLFFLKFKRGQWI